MAAPMINSVTANFTRLRVAASCSLQLNRCLRTQAHPLLFLTTDSLQKKPTHSQMVSKRLIKRRKDLEKALAKMDRKAVPIRAPIKENLIEMKLEKEAVKTRKREPSVPPEEWKKEIETFLKEWEVYCKEFTMQETHKIQKRLLSQQRALEELRKESEELYQKAIEIDEDMYNFSVKRLTETPAIPGFQPIDGEYKDVTIRYD